MRGHEAQGDKRLQERVNLKAILADPQKRGELVLAVQREAWHNDYVANLSYHEALVRIVAQLIDLGEDPHAAAVAVLGTGDAQ